MDKRHTNLESVKHNQKPKQLLAKKIPRKVEFAGN